MDKLARLKKKRRAIIKRLPKFDRLLRTTISKYYLTCGYKKCRCHRGEKHGPFIYLSVTKKGKTKMYFTPQEIVKEVKEGVKNYDKLWRDICQLCELNRQILWLKKKWE
jgi:hypothetical protein